ncbi:hypothetical protein KI387_043804 [Taxus chinensis]|uniref:Uncharacterized protein n=1 Tax=Taxus chinensis TaxID=29808 RepID=A0AA38KZJ5_TAXCH|nr:hypothetical protein KI387_043804 [Taxus chinensis]
MTITHEDIFRILRLPIAGDSIEITPREQQQRALGRLYRDRADDSEIVSGAMRIASQYRQDTPRSRRIVLIQMAISYFALPDSGGHPGFLGCQAVVGGIDYGFRRWWADMATGDTGRSAEWYSERFRTLTSDQVIWRPYRAFPTWAGQDAHLVALRRSRVVRGLDPLREAPPSADSDDDAGVDEGYAAWYDTELPRHLPPSIDADEEDIAATLDRLEVEHATLTQTHQVALEEIRALKEERDALIVERDTARQE